MLGLVGSGKVIAVLRAVGSDNGNLRLSCGRCGTRRLVAVRLQRMVLCRRPGWQRVIASVFTGNRMVHKMRVMHDQGAAIVAELIATLAVPERRVGIPDGDGMNGLLGEMSDVFRVNSVIDEMAIMNIEVVDDRGVVDEKNENRFNCDNGSVFFPKNN